MISREKTMQSVILPQRCNDCQSFRLRSAAGEIGVTPLN
jgi:hypothetical protein